MENNNKEQASAIQEVKEILEKLGLTEEEIHDVLDNLQLEDVIPCQEKRK